MKTHKLSLLRVVSVLALTLLCGFASAQTTSPSGSYGFLINASFSFPSDPTSPFPTGLAILGVMNFDGAGNATGPYTYEVDTNSAQVAQTTTGTFTGTYSSNPDGTGSVTMALDNGINLTLAMVVSEGGQSLRLAATDYQFPAATCGCRVSNAVLSGTARATPAGALNGAFGFQLANLPNVNVSLGVATFDGAGNVTLLVIFVGSSDSKGNPAAPFPITDSGTYSINPDGTGTINLPAVPGVTNSLAYSFVVTDSGSGLLLIQTDRRGNGVTFGTARQQ